MLALSQAVPSEECEQDSMKRIQSRHDVGYRHAELGQYHLAGDGYLPLQRAIGRAGVIGDAEVGSLAAGILEGALQGLAGQVFQGTLQVTAEHGHGDPGDVDIAHLNS